MVYIGKELLSTTFNNNNVIPSIFVNKLYYFFTTKIQNFYCSSIYNHTYIRFKVLKRSLKRGLHM